MELITIILLGVFAETSYLTFKAIAPQSVGKKGVLIDTSVLIDGRILPIARSGLISAKLIVPSSVVRELQFMADKADHDKRERARFGLDMISQLQALDGVTIDVVDDGITDQHGVDEQLLRLAKRWDSKLCTIDYNLNKSARVQGIDVININELAHALRVTYLPGEKLEVKLQQQGQESHQAVGYLDDGTMVVVDRAKELIGQTISVEATRVLQTAAGKMMFAKHTVPTKSTQKAKTTANGRQPKSERHKPAQHNKQSRKPVRSTVRKTKEDALIELANQ
jgi:uncharacterized protein YacL